MTSVVARAACATLRDLSLGREIHSKINESNIEWNIEMINSLLNMYSKCGSMDDARSLFDTVKLKDAIIWNTLIQGYAANGNEREALVMFRQMQQEGLQPDI